MYRQGSWALVVVALISCKAAPKKSTAPTLKSVDVVLAQPSVALGQPDGITASAVYSDGARTDISVLVTWGTSAPFVATIGCGSTGCSVATHDLGSAILTASYQGVSGTATISAVAAEATDLTVSISMPTIPKGARTYVDAISNFTDTSTFDVTAHCVWTSSDETIATVTCSDGQGCQASGIGVGTATLTATFGTFTGMVDIQVTEPVVTSVALSDSIVSLGVAGTQTVQATATYSDETTADVSDSAVWVSSDASVATVSGGTITAVAAGEATITASVDSSSATLTVLVAAEQTGLTITTVTPTVALGNAFQMTANAEYVGDTSLDATSEATWSSSDTSVATVSSGGLVSTGGVGHTTGTATITARYGGFMDTTVLTVTDPAPASIRIGSIPSLHAGDVGGRLSATVVDTNGGTHAPVGTVSWSVNAEAFATVDQSGVLTPKAAGIVAVTASADNVSGTTSIPIGGALAAVVVSPGAPTVPSGQAVLLTAAGFYQGASATADLSEDVSWSASNSVVFVNITQSSRAQVLVGCNSSGMSTVTASVTLASGATVDGHATVTCP